MSDELVIILLACLVWFSAFVVLIAYVDDKITAIKTDIMISEIKGHTKKD